jgi:hypothetical protein
MVIATTDYMPVLKWRQGEYQALWRLNDAQKARIVPLIEVTPPDFDFEQWQPKKTIGEHLENLRSGSSRSGAHVSRCSTPGCSIPRCA